MKFLGLTAAALTLVATAGATCHGDYTDELYDKNKAFQAAKDAV